MITVDKMTFFGFVGQQASVFADDSADLVHGIVTSVDVGSPDTVTIIVPGRFHIDAIQGSARIEEQTHDLDRFYMIGDYKDPEPIYTLDDQGNVVDGLGNKLY